MTGKRRPEIIPENEATPEQNAEWLKRVEAMLERAIYNEKGEIVGIRNEDGTRTMYLDGPWIAGPGKTYDPI